MAHELNSLLDGSMRSLRLAQRALTSDEMLTRDRLALVEASLAAMAELLGRSLAGNGDAGLFNRGQTVREAVADALDAVHAAAEERSAAIEVRIAPAAAALPSGPLSPVLLNGLRNAIDACANTRSAHIELSIDVNTKDELVLSIADNGSGIDSSNKPSGYGIGLELSREIVTSLGGRLELMNVPFGRGAVLRVAIPVEQLQPRSHGGGE